MIPEPDYSDNEEDQRVARKNNLNNVLKKRSGSGGVRPLKEHKDKANCLSDEDERLDANGLIMPKKLVNPNISSTDKKSLHRELMFNQKMGVNVLNQKTELEKEMQKRKELTDKKKEEEKKVETLTPFQKVLTERAQRLEQLEKSDLNKKENHPEESSNEFQKIHAKLRAKKEAQ